MKHVLSYRNREFEIRALTREPPRVEIREADTCREFVLPAIASGKSGRIELNGKPKSYWVTACSHGFWVTVGGQTFFLEKSRGLGSSDDGIAGGFAAPMPGKIISVKIEPGARVEKRDVLVLMEAMKMEHRIEAPCAGTVTEVLCEEGALVEQGTELLVFESDEG